MVKKENVEQHMDLTFQVKMHVYGKPNKHIDDVGIALANELGLQFGDCVVTRGKTTYARNKAPVVADSNDTRVV